MHVYRILIISNMIQKDAGHVVFVGMQFCVNTHNNAG